MLKFSTRIARAGREWFGSGRADEGPGIKVGVEELDVDVMGIATALARTA